MAVLFTILNVFLFRTDSVPDISEIYAVERPQQANGDRSPLTRPQFRSVAIGHQRLHRCLRGGERHRSAGRRPDDGGQSRVGEISSGRARRSRHGTRAQRRRRRSRRRQPRDRAERQGMDSASFNRDPQRDWTHGARHRRAVRDRRRHAGGIPRSRGQRARLLGAARPPRRISCRTPAAGRQGRHRDRRPAETRRVDGERPRPARGVGLEPIGDQRTGR